VACLVATTLLTVPAQPSAAGEAAVVGDPVGVLQVRPDIYMLTVAGGLNLALESGPDGAVLVNAGPSESSADVLAAVRRISSQPLRFLVNTSADPDLVGGNAQLAAAGSTLKDVAFGVTGVAPGALGNYAPIIAYQNVLTRMTSEGGASTPEFAMPSETFTRPVYNFYMNGQGIQVVHQSAAHSDGDAVVRFLGSDVVVTGKIFDITRFPDIDVQHGGSLQGEIDALNELINFMVVTPIPVVTPTGGTLVIPARGPVCDQADLVTYRDMLFGVRSRVQDGIDHGKSLAQIRADDPTQGYSTRFGASAADTDRFVEAVFTSLTRNKGAHRATESRQ